jgi:hypothetical protein
MLTPRDHRGPNWSTPGQGADRTKRYQMELLRQPKYVTAAKVLVRVLRDVRGHVPTVPKPEGEDTPGSVSTHQAACSFRRPSVMRSAGLGVRRSSLVG